VRTRSISSWAAVALLAAISLIADQPAHAGYRKCSQTVLLASDAVRFRVLARSLAQGREILWSSQYVCVYRGRAHSTVETKPEPQADGTVLHPHIRCDREKRGPWSCNRSVARYLPMSPIVGGQSRPLEVQLPEALDAGEARILVERALALAPTLDSRPECGADGSSVGEPVTQEWKDWMRKDLGLGWPHNNAGIDALDAGRFEVSINSFIIEFVRVEGPSPRFEFQCWYVPVVVT
jgi:hypothetical protein